MPAVLNEFPFLSLSDTGRMQSHPVEIQASSGEEEQKTKLPANKIL